ncbi:MAG: autotransporter domain-containing protein [Pirellulales bacterium]|nr:autotransporter domain-containing protein [Pirellulales bacterium]
MSCLDKSKMPVRKSPLFGRWRRTVAKALCLATFALLIATTIGSERAHAQHPAITQVGGFNVQFWNAGDNAAGGAFMLGGGVIADGDLGVFSADQIAAVERALQYWSDRLGLPAANANSPVIRFAIDAATPAFNAFAASQGADVGGGMFQTNTFDRLVNGNTPQRADTVGATETGIDGAIAFIPGTDAFDTSVMTQIPTLNSMEAIAIHEIGHLLGMVNTVPVFDQDQALMSVELNQAWVDNVVDPNAPTSVFTGATVQGLFGGPLPIQNPDTHLLLDFANLTRSTPFGKDFRNQGHMSPLELAAFVDMGYTVNLADHFGAAFYTNGNGIQAATGGFAPTQEFANGVYVQADNRNLLVNANVSANGFASTGIRLNGGQEPGNTMNGNKVTIAPGTSVSANGTSGVGLFASAGANHVLVHRGTINATGANGRGVLIDFTRGLLNFPGLQITSEDYQSALVSRFDLTGTINTLGGTGTAIEIGPTAAVGEINIMQGAVINGNIVSSALSTAGLNAPTLTFGRTADANGEATATPDGTFFFDYVHNITGVGPNLNGDLVGGETRFNGSVIFQNLMIRSGATLGGAGMITSAAPIQQMGTIAPGNSIGTLTINGDLNSVGGAYNIEIQPGGPNPVAGVDNDLIVVSGFANLQGGTVNVDAAPGIYNIGERYTFIITGGGVTVGTPPTVMDNIPGFRAVQFQTPFTFGITIGRDGVTGLLGRTFNQVALGTYLDLVRNNPNPDFQRVRDILDADPNVESILAALDQMVGDIHGTMALVSMQNTSQMYGILSRQMQGACCGCDGTWDGWILGYGRGGDVDYDGNAAGIDYTVGGTTFGAARCLGGPRVGFFGNYTAPSVNSFVPIAHAKSRSYALGGFIEGYDVLGHFLFAGSVGYDEYTVNRYIQFASINRMASSEYDGVQHGFYAEHDLDISLYFPNIYPVTSLQYINVHQAAFGESGAGSLNLAGSGNNTQSLRTFTGIQYRGDSIMGRGWSATPQMQVGWQHEHLDKSSLYTARFNALGPISYTARGLDFGRNWALLGMGLELAHGNHWSIFGGYDVYANGRQALHTGTGSVSFAW